MKLPSFFKRKPITVSHVKVDKRPKPVLTDAKHVQLAREIGWRQANG